MSSQEIDYFLLISSWLQAIGTLVGVLAAAIGIWWQIRKQWLLNSANVVSSFADRWGTDEWRKYRIYSAKAIKKHLEGKPVDLSKDLPILGFFEHIGYLARRGGLDKEMIWNKFGWYIVRYHMGLSYKNSLIEQNRVNEGDHTLWEELDWLASEMLKIYRKKGVKLLSKDKLLTDESIRLRIQELLKQELNLKIK